MHGDMYMILESNTHKWWWCT